MIRSGRRGLAAGHRIDQVVNANDFEINVAAGGVDQVIAADRGEIAIAGIDHDVQSWDWPASGRWRRGSRVPCVV